MTLLQLKINVLAPSIFYIRYTFSYEQANEDIFYVEI